MWLASILAVVADMDQKIGMADQIATHQSRLINRLGTIGNRGARARHAVFQTVLGTDSDDPAGIFP